MTDRSTKTDDTRIVSGAQCFWWGAIGEVGVRVPNGFLSPPITPERLRGQTAGLPCCPHCGGMLFEVGSIDAWWAGVDAYEARGNPGYRRMIEFSRGRHFRSQAQAQAAYDDHVNRLMLEPRQ